LLKNALAYHNISNDRKIRIFAADDGEELAAADILTECCYVATIGGENIGSRTDSAYYPVKEITAGPPVIWPFGAIFHLVGAVKSSGKTFIEVLSKFLDDFHKDDKLMMRLVLPFGKPYNIISAEPELNFLASEDPAKFEKVRMLQISMTFSCL
jgi:hypothetical protein